MQYTDKEKSPTGIISLPLPSIPTSSFTLLSFLTRLTSYEHNVKLRYNIPKTSPPPSSNGEEGKVRGVTTSTTGPDDSIRSGRSYVRRTLVRQMVV